MQPRFEKSDDMTNFNQQRTYNQQNGLEKYANFQSRFRLKHRSVENSGNTRFMHDIIFHRILYFSFACKIFRVGNTAKVPTESQS